MLVYKNCKECGKEFSPAAANQVLCSEVCRKIDNARRRRENYRKRHTTSKTFDPKICVVCGKEFIPKTSANNKTCSEDCRKGRNAQKYREYYANKNKMVHELKENERAFTPSPPDIVCEFRHLRPGDPGFDDVAKLVIPLDKIKKVAVPDRVLNPRGRFVVYD